MTTAKRTGLKNNLIKIAIFAIVLLLLACAVVVAVPHRESARADDNFVDIVNYKSSSVTDVSAYVAQKAGYVGDFSGEGGSGNLNLVKVPLTANWKSTFLGSWCRAMITIVLDIENDKGEHSDGTEARSAQVSFGDTQITLNSATCTGTTYRNQSYTGSFFDIQEAGYYKITSMSFSYDFGIYAGGHVTGANSINATAISADPDGNYKLSDVTFVMQSNLYIDNGAMALYNDNLAISAANREYGASDDFKSLVSLNQTTMFDRGSNFSFSTSVGGTNNYDVSNDDIRLFRLPLSGLGNYYDDRYVESGAHSGNLTNLSGLADYLCLNWYLKDSNGGYIMQKDAIVNADEYYICVENSNMLTYTVTESGGRKYVSFALNGEYALPSDMQPVLIKNSSTQELFRQKFTVLKRNLYLELLPMEEGEYEGASSIDLLLSKEYNGNTDASQQFINKAIDRDFWLNVMHGIAYDYDDPAINRELTAGPYSLFTFEGSSFVSAETGTNKTVNMKIGIKSFNSLTDGVRAAGAKTNYNCIASVNGVPISVSGDGSYQLGADFKFEIRSNSIKVFFADGATPDILTGLVPDIFDNSIDYGQYRYGDDRVRDNRVGTPMTISDYSIVHTGTALDNGIIKAQYRNNWKFVIQSGGTRDGRPIVTADTENNTVYIVVKLGKKIGEGDDSEVFYTDADGEYTDYNSFLFAGQYYFYYSIYYTYRTGSGNELIEAVNNRGEFIILGTSGTPIFTIATKAQILTIAPKVLHASLTDYILDKDYDGTDSLLKYDIAIESDGIIAEDAQYVRFEYSATYTRAGAGEEVGINVEPKLVANTVNATTNQMISSYTIDTDGIAADKKVGTIRKVALTVNFLEVNYSRKFNTQSYVAILVGRRGEIGPDGSVLPEDYYYYCITVGSNTIARYCYESELSGQLRDSMIIKVSLEGFIDGEGFPSSGNIDIASDIDPKDFMLEKLSNDPTKYNLTRAPTERLLSWYDSLRGVQITPNTNCSQTPEDLYRLEINELGFSFPNYSLGTGTEPYGWLFIRKLDVRDELIRVVSNPDLASGIEYDSNSHIDEMFINGTVNIDNHPEVAQIRQYVTDNGGHYGMLLQVSRFDIQCENPMHSSADHNISLADADVADMVMAGLYKFRLELPSTTNYNSYSVDVYGRIEAKTVDVYVTYAFKVYGDDMIEYTQTDVIYGSNINDYTVRGDLKGNLSTDPNYDGNKVYIAEKASMANNTTYEYGSAAYDTLFGSRKNQIIYIGLLPSDTINTAAGDRYATVSITYTGGRDAAMMHAQVVRPQGAYKHNYKFRYNNDNLYVKKKNLTITVDVNQEKFYTGYDITPDYEISGGDGLLAMYIKKINNDDLADSDGKYNEDNSSVLDIGEYIVAVYAKPDPAGGNADNYEESREKIDVTLKVKPTPLELIPGSDETTFMYNMNSFESGVFDDYIQGTDGTDAIRAMTGWGDIEIISATKIVSGGTDQTITDFSKIIDSGEYKLRLRATVKNHKQMPTFEGDDDAKAAQEQEFLADINNYNIYFPNGGNKSLVYEFDLELTIEQSDNFIFDMQVAGVTGSVGSGYSKTYDGDEVRFLYTLLADIDRNDGSICVVGAVNGILYSVNNKIYTADDADEAAGLPTIDFAGKHLDTANVANRLAMLNAGEYVLTFFINFAEYSDYGYNENYVGMVIEFTLNIKKKDLRVMIDFKDGSGPYKTYNTENPISSIKYIYAAESWVGSDGTDSDILNEIVDPTIDWKDLTKTSPVGWYTICATDRKMGDAVITKAPSNYYFDYSFSDISYEVRRAEAELVVYGTYDEVNDEYLKTHTYTGTVQVPLVLRRSTDTREILTEDKETIGSDGISIIFKGLFVGTDVNNITEADIAPVSDCKDVGKYVFEVSCRRSQNYLAVAPKLYYYEITKAELYIHFVQKTSSGYIPDVRGYASKVYDGERGNYPAFDVVFGGFVGDDAEEASFTNIYKLQYGVSTTDSKMGLVMPTYKILEPGKTDSYFTPTAVDTYNIKVMSDGETRNYNLNVAYQVYNNKTRYPEMQITSRLVDVVAGTAVQKIYDATTKITATIEMGNYLFVPVKDEHGNIVPDSGIVEGDVVNATFDPVKSRYERADVYDADDNTQVNIRIYGFVIDNPNYMLKIGTLMTDDEGESYFCLIGGILPASAVIGLTNRDGARIDGDISRVYDATPHGLTVSVRGVSLGDGLFEEVPFEMYYVNMDDLDDEDAEIGDDKKTKNPPVTVGSYKFILQILGKNYNPSPREVKIFIKRAKVDIDFRGDVSQIYGSVEGVVAIATGVGDYYVSARIEYYDEEGNFISDITRADAGEYRAFAIHEESANFELSDDQFVKFTIKRRAMNTTMQFNTSYVYNGQPVPVKIYFEYNGEVVFLNIRYNIIIAGETIPFNYGNNPYGQGVPVPIDAGRYEMAPNNNMKNFDVTDDYFVRFDINPAPLSVTVNDITVMAGTPYTPNYSYDGLVNRDVGKNIWILEPQIKYTTAAGIELETAPTQPGSYRMIAYGAMVNNYTPEYGFGILNINKSSITQEMTGDADGSNTAVMIEGSFGSDAVLVVRQADDLQFSQYRSTLDLFSMVNTDYRGMGIAALYNMSLNDGNVTAADGGMMTIRIYSPDYFSKFKPDREDFYVAKIKDDGTVQIISAKKEGDYLVFKTDSLDAFALLTDAEETAKGKDLSWLIYLGVSLGVVAIVAVIVVVVVGKKKKKS